MTYPNAKVCLTPIFALVLLLSQGCASGPQVLYRDKVSVTEVLVFTKLDPILTADCAPSYEYPPAEAASLTVRDTVERLKAVEEALQRCRMQLGLVRDIQDSIKPGDDHE